MKDLEGVVVYNWIGDMDLRCSANWQIGLFGSVFFIGHVLGSTFLAQYGDSIGRIILMRLSQGLTLLAYIIVVYFSRNLLIIYLMIFFMGSLSCWRLSLSFIYGQEIVSDTVQNVSGSLFMVADSTVMISSSFFIQYVSGQWVYLHTVYIVLVLTSFCIFYILPESPKYLV